MRLGWDISARNAPMLAQIAPGRGISGHDPRAHVASSTRAAPVEGPRSRAVKQAVRIQ
jgi:hypothetical protein